jgi:hypothetical protein
MKPGLNVEYRVREIKRYTVTRHETQVSDDGTEACGSNRQIGSHYDNFETAYAVGYALCSKEHNDLGYDLSDDRIRYPISVPPGTVLSLDPSFHSEDEIKDIGSVVATPDGELEAIKA